MTNKDSKADHEVKRREAWVAAWAATASAANCTKYYEATQYADHMLEAYDKRFRYVEPKDK